MPDSFLDSNVILYSLSQDEAKQRKTLELLAVGGVISTQPELPTETRATGSHRETPTRGY